MTTVEQFKPKRFKPSNEISENFDVHSSKLKRFGQLFSVVPPIVKSSSTDLWSNSGKTVAGGDGFGCQLNQLFHPWSVCVDSDDSTVFVAECSNHRVTAWSQDQTKIEIVAGGRKLGNNFNQLNGPANVLLHRQSNSLIIADKGNRRVVRWSLKEIDRPEILISNIDCWGLTMNSQGYLYVSDFKMNNVQCRKIGDQTSTIVAGSKTKGDKFDQLVGPSFLAIDERDSIYVSDIGNNRVMKWFSQAQQGEIVAGGHGRGSQKNQVSYPAGLAVDHDQSIFVVDTENHRLMRWSKNETEGTVVLGENCSGDGMSQFNGPTGLYFNGDDDIYIADNLNHRIQKFSKDNSSNEDVERNLNRFLFAK